MLEMFTFGLYAGMAVVGVLLPIFIAVAVIVYIISKL